MSEAFVRIQRFLTANFSSNHHHHRCRKEHCRTTDDYGWPQSCTAFWFSPDVCTIWINYLLTYLGLHGVVLQPWVEVMSWKTTPHYVAYFTWDAGPRSQQQFVAVTDGGRWVYNESSNHRHHWQELLLKQFYCCDRISPSEWSMDQELRSTHTYAIVHQVQNSLFWIPRRPNTVSILDVPSIVGVSNTIRQWTPNTLLFFN